MELVTAIQRVFCIAWSISLTIHKRAYSEGVFHWHRYRMGASRHYTTQTGTWERENGNRDEKDIPLKRSQTVDCAPCQIVARSSGFSTIRMIKIHKNSICNVSSPSCRDCDLSDFPLS